MIFQSKHLWLEAFKKKSSDGDLVRNNKLTTDNN